MKHLFIALLLFGGCLSLRAEDVVLSKLDPAFADAREKEFIPWGTQEDSTAAWDTLSPSNIPIYNEKKDGGLMRDIYIPREGAAYWVLNGLTKESVFSITEEKKAIGLNLISASRYKDASGKEYYWALWIAPNKEDYVKSKMIALGITPAYVEYSFLDRLIALSGSLNPFAGVFAFLALCVGLLNFLAILLIHSSLKAR